MGLPARQPDLLDRAAGAKFPGNLDGGLFQLLTWGEGNADYVYVYSTSIQRDKAITLIRNFG